MTPFGYNAKAYAAAAVTSPLARTTIPRRDPTARDVQIEILFCGICHSDLHYARQSRRQVPLCDRHGLAQVRVEAGRHERVL